MNSRIDNNKRALRVLLLVISGFLFSSCGGGGPNPFADDPELSVSSSNVTFSVNKNGTTPSSQSVTATASGGTVYIALSSTSNAIYEPLIICNNSSSCTIDILPRSPNSLTVGTHTDTITVRGCSDPGCGSVYSTHTITVTYTVSEGGLLRISPTALNVSTLDGVAPTSQLMNVFYSGGVATSWTAQINYLSTTAGWLSLSSMGDSTTSAVDISADFSILPVGSYQAEILFSTNGGTINVTVPVQYNVEYVRTVPAIVNFTVDLNTLPADQSQVVTVTSDFGAESTQPVVNWTASKTASWYTLTPNSGDTNTQNQFTVQLIQSELVMLDNGIYTDDIVLTSTDPAIQDVIIPVELEMNMPRVTTVTPYIGYTNQSNSVILRGTGFSGITPANISFGTDTAISVEEISDSAIRVVYPTLAAGNYSISVVDAYANSHISSAELHIKDAPSLPDLNMARSGFIERVIFDEEREVVYVLNRTNTALERYQYNGIQWVADSVTTPSLPMDMALTKDGQELLVLLTNEILHIDPISLNITNTTVRPFGIFNSFDRIATLNDGTAVIAFSSSSNWLYLYDITQRTLQSTGSALFYLYGTDLAASADGGRAFVCTFNSGVVNYIARFDSHDDSSTMGPSTGTASHGTADRTGSKYLMRRSSFQVFDGDMNFLGRLRSDRPVGATVSPDGTKAYSFNDLIAGTTIYSHNLTVPANASSEFPSTAITTVSPGVGLNVHHTMSSDGSLLIVASEDRIVVINLP